MRHSNRLRTAERAPGSALLEALIAFLVLSLGMLTVARLQTHLRLQADISRQRSEAVRLAQKDIENLRAFSVLSATSGQPAYDDIAGSTYPVDAASGYASQTEYRLSRRIEPAPSIRAKSARVTVGWTDLGGNAQQVMLQSIIAGIDPSLSGALALAHGSEPVTAPYGRSVHIPLDAKDLANGHSAFKPVSNGGVALVLDNLNGHVIGRCSGIDPALATADLTSAALGSCDARVGLLLSGTVRFSSASPPDPDKANAAALPLSMTVILSNGLYPLPPWCADEAMKTVSTTADGLHFAAVPLAAMPPWPGLAGLGLGLGPAAWNDTGDRHVQYRCVVYPASDGTWSGRSELVANGWTIGNGAAQWRVCRYSRDLDGSGAIDVNIEHPSDYKAVNTALANQNFLVIRGSESCPVAAPVRIAGPIAGQPSDVFTDSSTLQHQP